MEPEAAAPGDTFVTKGRVRLAEAVRHLVDATLTAEDASSEQLANAAKKVERIATEQALRMIAALPHNQAEVVMLRVVAGLDVSQTAEVLGKRPGAVRIAAMRGLRRLGETLGAERDTGPELSGSEQMVGEATE